MLCCTLIEFKFSEDFFFCQNSIWFDLISQFWFIIFWRRMPMTHSVEEDSTKMYFLFTNETTSLKAADSSIISEIFISWFLSCALMFSVSSRSWSESQSELLLAVGGSHLAASPKGILYALLACILWCLANCLHVWLVTLRSCQLPASLSQVSRFVCLVIF